MRVPAAVFAGALLAVAPALAQAPPRAPEYDVNAEVTVRGEVAEIHESKVATDHPGLHLVLRNEEGTVEVHACPVRFLSELEFTVAVGDKLAVTGSRPKGAAVIVAREITRGQLSLVLRDKKGVPNWLPR
jgi:DNA/RNA endonuclease YhcR with UshA esterase domain